MVIIERVSLSIFLKSVDSKIGLLHIDQRENCVLYSSKFMPPYPVVKKSAIWNEPGPLYFAISSVAQYSIISLIDFQLSRISFPNVLHVWQIDLKYCQSNLSA